LDYVTDSQTHTDHTSSSPMPKTVYYLTHRDTGLRERYYKNRAGARIAQRARNRLLGFRDRVERVCLGDNWEVEQCRLADGRIETATYCIVEDTVDDYTDQ
jgi:hypothetical protein